MKQIKFILLVLITNLFIAVPAYAVDFNRNIQKGVNYHCFIQLKTENRIQTQSERKQKASNLKKFELQITQFDKNFK